MRRTFAAIIITALAATVSWLLWNGWFFWDGQPQGPPSDEAQRIISGPHKEF